MNMKQAQRALEEIIKLADSMLRRAERSGSYALLLEAIAVQDAADIAHAALDNGRDE